MDEVGGVVEHPQLQRADWCIASFCGRSRIDSTPRPAPRVEVDSTRDQGRECKDRYQKPEPQEMQQPEARGMHDELARDNIPRHQQRETAKSPHPNSPARPDGEHGVGNRCLECGHDYKERHPTGWILPLATILMAIEEVRVLVKTRRYDCNDCRKAGNQDDESCNSYSHLPTRSAEQQRSAARRTLMTIDASWSIFNFSASTAASPRSAARCLRHPQWHGDH